ncbi:HAMP domain-containing histidine kinase [bacterium]|nr:HAMP domain-containing histidine kinase [bacterium]
MKHTQFIHQSDKAGLVENALAIFERFPGPVPLKCNEKALKKVFSGMIRYFIKDLELQPQTYQDDETSHLAAYCLKSFHHDLQLKGYFNLQVRLIEVFRSIISSYLRNRYAQNTGKGTQVLLRLSMVLEQTIDRLSREWEAHYRAILHRDQVLIDEFRIVKNDMQKQLMVIYQILKESPVAVICLDNEFRIIHWNRMAEKTTGYSPPDIMKKSVLTLFTDKSQMIFLRKIQSERKVLSNFKLYLQQKAGNPIQVMVAITRIKHAHPGQIFFILSLQEVLNKLRENPYKQQLSQLTTIARLTSAIMHDIRNPINTLGLNLELLEQALMVTGGKVQAKVSEYITVIGRALQQMKTNLNQYLSYSHISELYPERMNLIELLQTLVDDLSLEAQVKGISLRYDAGARELWVLGDWVQIRRAFVNLIQNALEALNTSGSIVIKTYRRKQRVYTVIRDNGPGIPPNLKRKVFEPFFTTKNTGTGLGLFIAREIVRAHHGNITCRSESEVGTRFTISIPSSDVRPEKPADAT